MKNLIPLALILFQTFTALAADIRTEEFVAGPEAHVMSCYTECFYPKFGSPYCKRICDHRTAEFVETVSSDSEIPLSCCIITDHLVCGRKCDS